MKRRSFAMMTTSILAGASAYLARPQQAKAALSTADADRLKNDLTPMGAERAASADGTIPAWTGGFTDVPAGWTESQQEPDFFADDAIVVSIDASNMAQYKDKLTDGLMAMMAKYSGFSIKVYPTHRTAAAPQWVYDNIYQNALKSSLDPRGGRFGFSGAYGGIPFPILDSDPDAAGSQIIWNHLLRWEGFYSTSNQSSYVISGGNVSLTGYFTEANYYNFYDQSGSLANFSGFAEYTSVRYLSPPVLVGQAIIAWNSTNALNQPAQNWELLDGQGRVRKAPELTYDTPQSTSDGVQNYDESYGFYGAPDRYNWKLIGKQEMYIPYNNNGLIRSDPNVVIKANFIDPNAVRYELHRVYVVEATLASGERNVIARRRLLVDEDNWHIAVVDEYDANGNIVKLLVEYNLVRPSLPGTVFANQTSYNLQTGDYEMGTGIFTTPSNPGFSSAPIGRQNFNPASLAASAQY